MRVNRSNYFFNFKDPLHSYSSMRNISVKKVEEIQKHFKLNINETIRGNTKINQLNTIEKY